MQEFAAVSQIHKSHDDCEKITALYILCIVRM